MASKADITSPVDRLLAVLKTLERSGDSELADWFRQCLDGYFSGTDLEEAFDLCSQGAGQEKPLTLWLRFQRDQAIREAFRHIQGRNQVDKVTQLRAALMRPMGSGSYASGMWRAVDKARRTGLHVPTSMSRLTEIIDHENYS
jgi:hypothetical protein